MGATKKRCSSKSKGYVNKLRVPFHPPPFRPAALAQLNDFLACGVLAIAVTLLDATGTKEALARRDPF